MGWLRRHAKLVGYGASFVLPGIVVAIGVIAEWPDGTIGAAALGAFSIGIVLHGLLEPRKSTHPAAPDSREGSQPT